MFRLPYQSIQTPPIPLLRYQQQRDVHYLNEIKYSGLRSCVLLGDKGYLSTEWQLDLFTSVNIELQTPKRANQKDYKPWPWVYKSTRKRIEVIFDQLFDQMMLKRNYAKTFEGLRARISWPKLPL